MSAYPCNELDQLLLTHACDALRLHLGLDSIPPARLPELERHAASFVTLKHNGKPRGRMGSVKAHRPLVDDVREHAVAAATGDKRFDPVTADEIPSLSIEVSVLSEAEFLDFETEDALCAQLRPGVDGLILFSGCRSATFLPEMWQQFSDAPGFLQALKIKAGLDPAKPTPNSMAARYQVTHCSGPATLTAPLA